MRIWVHNITEEKFISVGEFINYLESGWTRGRILSHRPPVRIRKLPEKTYRMRSPSGTIHTVSNSLYQLKKSRLKESGWKFVRQPRSTEFKKDLSYKMSNSVWISSPERRMRINTSFLNKYISLGWTRGMRYTSSNLDFEFTVSDIKSPDISYKLSFLRNDIDENQGLHYHNLN